MTSRRLPSIGDPMAEDRHDWSTPPAGSPPPAGPPPAPPPASSRLPDGSDTGAQWPTQPVDGMVVPAGLQHEARGGGFRRFVGSGLVRLVVVGVVLGGGALWGAIQAANRDDSGQIVGAGDVDAFDLQVGDCLAEPEGTEIASVQGLPCSEPHDFEVIHNATLTGSAAPTDAELGPLIGQHCLPAFETYVGIPYGDHPTLYVDVLWPSPESWAEGDRVLTCFVFDTAGALTASVRAN